MKYAALVATAATLVIACGPDETGPTPTSFASQSEAPLELAYETRGVHFHLSDAASANHVAFGELSDAAANIVVYEQIYSEVRSLTSAPTERYPEYDRRIEEVYDHNRLGDSVASFDTTYFVVDFERLDDEWLVDWEGGARDDPENREESMNFARDDYREDTVDRIVEAFTVRAPESLIIGHGMERWYLQNPDDWGNFVSLVHETVAAVHEYYPETRIAVGIDWSRFVDEVVPMFRDQVEVLPAEGRSFDATLLAWETLIAPLYYDASGAQMLDFWAFTSAPAAENVTSGAVDDQHYLGVRSLMEAGWAMPVAWYGIGLPLGVDSSRDFTTFANRFLELNGGYEVELVSWYGLYHLLNDECSRLQDPNRGVNADNAVCVRGMFSMSGADIADLPQILLDLE